MQIGQKVKARPFVLQERGAPPKWRTGTIVHIADRWVAVQFPKYRECFFKDEIKEVQ